MAKHYSVLYISAHGVVPSVASRECSAAKSLYFRKEHHHQAPPLPDLRSLDCTFEGGLAVQVEQTDVEVMQAWSAYIEKYGYNADWIRPLEAGVPGTDKTVFILMLTRDGIEHFFHNSQLSLVVADACKSMTFAPDFNAQSYFGYASTACSAEDLPDMQTLFDRLTGKDGMSFRNTSAAFAEGGWKSPVFELSLQRPISLSPAVFDAGVDPAVTLSPQSPKTRHAYFDTKMAENTGIITVNGCGATVSNEQWTNNDTTLNYDLTIPDQPSNGDTLTLTIGHDKAEAYPGGSPNDQLDGNQSPSPDSGAAPNQSDYVVEKIPCAPIMNLYASGSENGTTIGGYVVGGTDLTCTETGSPSMPYQLVLWSGSVPSGPDSWVNIAAEFNSQFGSWSLGTAQGDPVSTLDWLTPYTHIGSTSGTIDQTSAGGSIDATFSDGGGPISIKGTWNCPSTGVA
jgi:hypothetical protein